MKIIYTALVLSLMSLVIQAKQSDAEAKRQRNKVLPKVEQYYHDTYVVKNKKKRTKLEATFKRLKERLKSSKSKRQKKLLEKRQAEIKKELEVIYLYIDFGKAYHEFSTPKSIEDYNRNYKEILSLRKTYKELTGEGFPKFVSDYHKKAKKRKK